MLVRSSVPRPGESVIVWGVLKVPLVSKTIVLGAVGLGERLAGLLLVLTLAQPTAVRRVPTSLESAAVVTRYDELASKAPMSSASPAFRPAGPRIAPRWSVAGHGHARDRGAAGVDGRAARHEGHGLGGPAVVAQRSEQRIDVEQVGVLKPLLPDVLPMRL